MESPESRSKEMQIRINEAAKMKKEIKKLEKESAILRARAKDDE